MEEEKRIYKIKDVSGNNIDSYYNCLIEIFNNKENHKLIKDSYLNELKSIFANPQSTKKYIIYSILNNIYGIIFVNYYNTLFLPFVNIYLEKYNETVIDDDNIEIFTTHQITQGVFNKEGYNIILKKIKNYMESYKKSSEKDFKTYLEKDKEIIVKNILIELCSTKNVMVNKYFVEIIQIILAKYDIYVINMQTTYSKNESGEIVKLDLYNDIIKKKYINKFYTLDNNNDLDKKYIDHIINTTYDSLTSINYNIEKVEKIKYIVTFNNNIHYNYLYIDNNSIFKIFDIKRFKNKQEENIKKKEEAQRQKKADINFTIIANGGYNNKYIDNNYSKYNRKIYNKDGKEYVIYKYQKILLQKYKKKIQEIKKKEKISSFKSITSAKKKEKVSFSKNK